MKEERKNPETSVESAIYWKRGNNGMETYCINYEKYTAYKNSSVRKSNKID